MATRKAEKKFSHPIEVLREIYAMQDAERRLLGIAEALRRAESDISLASRDVAIRAVLRRSIGGEAKTLAEIGRRLNALLGPLAAPLGEPEPPNAPRSIGAE